MANMRDGGAPGFGSRPEGLDSAFHPSPPPERTIGNIIADAKRWPADKVGEVLAYQRQHQMRFGEAAVAMGLATDDDVLFALSQQFHYPYASGERRDLNPELVAAVQPFSQQAEAFRAIRSQLLMRMFSPDEPKRALAVVSPEPGDGKTFFAANLAVSLAQLGGRTLLVDADLRGPRQQEVFGVAGDSGLSSLLCGRNEANVIHQSPDLPGLYVLPVGVAPPNPLELVERRSFKLLLRELLGKFDHVIVDTPAAAFGADARVIASRCGAALVITRKNVGRMNRLQTLVNALRDSPVKLAGVIVNDY